jgi:hypothetical protein
MRRKKRRLTKVPGRYAMVHTSMRVPRENYERMVQAATKLGVSVSHLLRVALQEKTRQILDVSN